MLPGDGPIDPPQMSDGEYIQWLEAKIERLRKVIRYYFSLNPDNDETELIGRCIYPLPDDVRRTIIEECMAAEKGGK